MATFTVNENVVTKEQAQASLEEFFRAHGSGFEYVQLDDRNWEIQMKMPGWKAIIRPNPIGRDMNFDIILC